MMMQIFPHQLRVLPPTSAPHWCVKTTRRQWAGNTVQVLFTTKSKQAAGTVIRKSARQTAQAATCPTCTALRPTSLPSPRTLPAAKASTAPHSLTSLVSWKHFSKWTLALSVKKITTLAIVGGKSVVKHYIYQWQLCRGIQKILLFIHVFDSWVFVRERKINSTSKDMMNEWLHLRFTNVL